MGKRKEKEIVEKNVRTEEEEGEEEEEEENY